MWTLSSSGLLIGINSYYTDRKPQRMFSYYGRNLREEGILNYHENVWEYRIHVRNAKAFRIWIGNRHPHSISGIFWHGWDPPIHSLTVLAPDFIIPDELYTRVNIPEKGELNLHAGGVEGTVTPGSKVSFLLQSDHNHKPDFTGEDDSRQICQCCECGCETALRDGYPHDGYFGPPRRVKIAFLTDDEAIIEEKARRKLLRHDLQESILIY